MVARRWSARSVAARALTVVLALVTQGGHATSSLTDPDRYDGAIAWITDSQFYVRSWPQHFDAMTRWIAEHAAERKISYVAHTGDVVDDYRSPSQWAHATASMSILEQAGIPYGVLAGNHDVSLAASGWTDTDYRTFARHFGAGRFAGSAVHGGSFQDNRQHYDLVDVGGVEVLMVYTAWKPRPADYRWASQVLRAHPDTPAIVAAHEYLDVTGAYSGDGRAVFDELVAPHDNVVAVISGHKHGAASNIRRLAGGRQVLEMLHDYQALPEGGLGYLRLLQFDVDAGRLIVDTYSPVRDDVNYYEDGTDHIEASIDLSP